MLKILITSFFLSTYLLATEIDSFTLRDPFMKDSIAVLNTLMKNYFDKALKKANKEGSCDPKRMEEIFYEVSGGKTWAKLEEAVKDLGTLERKSILRENSIYRDISFLDAYGLYMAKLGYLMKIQDFYVGSDKIGHFIGIGYSYYEYPNIQEAMDFGELTERTYFGLTTTAIYSYGDLAANLEGYYFWNRVAKGSNPYFTCENKTWKQNADFDWSDYANPAWDEGLNCNYYKNTEITKFVQSQISQLGLTCPVNRKYCSQMIQRYGNLAPRVISPECF